MRGKKGESVVIATYFDQLLAEYFPDVFQASAVTAKKDPREKEKTIEETSNSTRKRPRNAIEAEETEIVPSASDRRRSRSEAPSSSAQSAGTKLTASQKVQKVNGCLRKFTLAQFFLVRMTSALLYRISWRIFYAAPSFIQ